MIEESPKQTIDRQLIARAAGGEEVAFSDLYDRLSGPLYSLALRMLGDTAEAEDALQDSFLQIWRRAASYDPAQSSVFSWAIRITRCRVIDRLRARGRRLRVVSATLDDEENPQPVQASEADSAADTASRKEEAAGVRRILGELSADQRQVLELAFFSDLTHYEIAERLGEPLGTIKARIRRGLLKLRDSIPTLK